MTTNPRIDGLILAGGRSRRMGGIDKGLYALNGRPMIEGVIATLRPQIDRLAISANRHWPAYAAYGYAVIRDHRPGYLGPLAGIETALQTSDADYLAVCPCDALSVPPDLVARLLAACREQRRSAACAVAVSSEGEQIQPLYALLSRQTLPSISTALIEGSYAVRPLMASLDAALCPFAATAFYNINTAPPMIAQTKRSDQ